MFLFLLRDRSLFSRSTGLDKSLFSSKKKFRSLYAICSEKLIARMGFDLIFLYPIEYIFCKSIIKEKEVPILLSCSCFTNLVFYIKEHTTI